MTTMLFRNPMAFALLSMAITGIVILIFFLAFGESFYSGHALRLSRWAAGTVTQYALAFGLAFLLREKDRKMTGRNRLYIIITLTLIIPGTVAQLAIIIWLLTTSV